MMAKSWWWTAGFIIIGVLLMAGIVFLVTRPPRGEAIVLLPPPTPSPITIYVTGAIAKAGLYMLPPGSRVNDAIIAAGGLTQDSDTESLNLARILEDGEQVNVPKLFPSTEAGIPPGSPGTTSNLVNINTATLEQLDTLPDIGEKTAQAIIDYRNKNGAFKAIEDIQNVTGIGEGIFSKIRDMITVGTSP